MYPVSHVLRLAALQIKMYSPGGKQHLKTFLTKGLSLSLISYLLPLVHDPILQSTILSSATWCISIQATIQLLWNLFLFRQWSYLRFALMYFSLSHITWFLWNTMLLSSLPVSSDSTMCYRIPCTIWCTENTATPASILKRTKIFTPCTCNIHIVCPFRKRHKFV